MKTIKCIILSVSLMLCLLIFSSDVVPENSHFVTKCLKIDNFSEFPDYYLIAYATGPVLFSNALSVDTISTGSCISKGYWGNIIRFFAIKKQLLQKYDSLAQIDFNKIAERQIFVGIEDPEGYYVSNDNDLQKIDAIYRISGIVNKKFVVYKYAQIEYYSSKPYKKYYFFKQP